MEPAGDHRSPGPGEDSRAAKRPKLHAFLLLKLTESLLLGLVGAGLSLALHYLPVPGGFMEAAEHLAADLAMRYRVDPRRTDARENVRPIVLIGDDSKADWVRDPAALHAVIEFVARRGAAAIVVDYPLWPHLLPDCSVPDNASSALCDRDLPPVIVALPHLRTSAEGAPLRLAPVRVKGAPWLCTREPNVWYAHAEIDPDGVRSPVLRGLPPWTWIERRHTGPPYSALPSVPVLTRMLAGAETVGAARIGRESSALQRFPAARARPDDCLRPHMEGETLAIGHWERRIGTDIAVRPIDILFEFPHYPRNAADSAWPTLRPPGNAEAAPSYGRLARNAASYRVLDFADVWGAAELADATVHDHVARTGRHQARSMAGFAGAVVIIGQIGVASRDSAPTPLGTLPGPVILANAIHSLSTVGVPGHQSLLAELGLEMQIVVVTAASFTVMFWLPIWAWRRLLSERRPRGDGFAAYCKRTGYVIGAVAAAAAAIVHATYTALFLVDTLVVPFWSDAIIAGATVNFVVPALLIMLKALIEVGHELLASLSRGTLIVLTSLTKPWPRLQAALHDAHGHGGDHDGTH